MDTPAPSLKTDWTRFAAELGAIPCIIDPAVVRQKSRDFFWYSPILKAQFDRKTADIVACPRTEAEVIIVAAQCARWRVPLTVRGGSTGNYGQAVPLHGGVVLDMTALDRILSLEDGLLTVEPGRKMGDIDAETRARLGTAHAPVHQADGYHRRLHRGRQRGRRIDHLGRAARSRQRRGRARRRLKGAWRDVACS